MFDQTFVNAQAQTRKPWTVLTSLSVQAIAVAALLIAPLFHIARLDAPPKLPIWLPVQRLDLKLLPDVKTVAHQSTVSRPVFREPVLRVPTSVPKHIDLTPDAPSLAVPQMTNGVAGIDSLAGLISDAPIQRPHDIVKPVTQPPTPANPPSLPLTVGGDVQAAKLIYSPRPPYPHLALTIRTQGTVVIRAVIARDGTIGNLQLISGPSLLVQAAMDAVRQWRYQPTLLNGKTVEVVTEISVNFTLFR